MISKYAKDIVIEPSRCDAEGKLSYAHAFSLFLDAAGEHADAIGVGIAPLMKKGLFWLTVRTRVHFYRRPRMLEPVTVSTWPEAPSKVRANRDYAITSGGETLLEGKTEWAVLDIPTGRPQPMQEVYPKGLSFDNPAVLEDPFVRLDPDFSGAKELGTYTVRSTDIDVGRHMNNAAYVHALFGLFSSEELKALCISEVEVAFRSPTYEGQRIRFLRRDGEGIIDISADVEGKNVFYARITI